MGENRSANRRSGKALLVQGEKRCSMCRLLLPLESFSIDNSRRDRRSLRCRTCVSLKWKTKTETCKTCGGPRSATSGSQCHRCYSIHVSIRRTERETLDVIPGMLRSKERETRKILKAIRDNPQLNSTERLLALVEKFT